MDAKELAGPSCDGKAGEKTCCLTEEDLMSCREDLARFYRALGHPARLAIISFLSHRPEASCGAIVKCLPLAQSTVSQHLLALKEAGLITCVTKGRCCHYRLATTAIQSLLTESGEFLAGLSKSALEHEADGPEDGDLTDSCCVLQGTS